MTDQAGQKRVVVTLPVLMVGGTEMQTLTLIRVLVAAEYEVTLCCFYQSDSHMVERFAAEGARVVLLAQQWESGLWSLLICLIRFFRAERPAIVHVQYMAPGLIPVVAARLAGVKLLIATVHHPGRIYSWKARIFLRVAGKLCRVFVCNSLAVEKSWFGSSWLLTPTVERASRGHLTIYNAVDCSRIGALADGADAVALRHEFAVPAGPVIGVIGRLRHEKGQALLLEAMGEVVKVFPTARLLVVGDGPDADTLKRHAAQTGLQTHIIWCGMTDADRVFQIYSLMDVVAVPSLFEGFGLVAAEAMAAGRAVVASAVDGLVEVVEDGVTGLLVPPGDSVALAAALIDLLQHPAKAIEMGRQGKARVRKLFSIERYRESILAAYAQGVNPGQTGGQG